MSSTSYGQITIGRGGGGGGEGKKCSLRRRNTGYFKGSLKIMLNYGDRKSNTPT